MPEKPEWLPDELWSGLQHYRYPLRRADPTDGFLLRMAKHHPDFNEREFWKKKSNGDRKKGEVMTDAMRTKLHKLLGIPKKMVADATTEENIR